MFKDSTQRQRMLKVFGPEFEKGYGMYKKVYYLLNSLEILKDGSL